MKFILLLITSFIFTSCTTPSQKLLGTWKSNKELTLPTIHYKKDPPGYLRKKVEGIFGKLEVTYTRKTLSIYAPDLGFKAGEWRYSTRYKVLGSDSESIAILSSDPLTHKPQILQIHFDSANRYWVYIEGSGWKEYFDRIKQG